jgi:hypothetical protein
VGSLAVLGLHPIPRIPRTRRPPVVLSMIFPRSIRCIGNIVSAVYAPVSIDIASVC